MWNVNVVRVSGVSVDALGGRVGVVVAILVFAFFWGSNVVREAAVFASDAVSIAITVEMAGRAEVVVIVQVSAIIAVETVAFEEPLAWSGSESLSIFSGNFVLSNFNAEAFPILVLSALTWGTGMLEITRSLLMAPSRKMVLAFASSVQWVFISAQLGWGTECSSPASVGARSTQCFRVMNEGAILSTRAAGTRDVELAWAALVTTPKRFRVSISIPIMAVRLLLLGVWGHGR